MNWLHCIVLFLVVFQTVLSANPLAELLTSSNLKNAAVQGAQISAGKREGSVLLTFPASDDFTSITLPVPAQSRDWTKFETFTFEFESSSTIFFEMQVTNAAGKTAGYRVQPMIGVPVRAAIPIAYLTREYMNNRQFKGHWLSSWGSHIEIGEVTAIVIRMKANQPVKLQLGPIALHTEPVDDAVFLKQPVVDEFGQWISLDWPGKVKNAAELKAAWKSEDAQLARPMDFGFSRFGGWKARKEKATGYFHTAQIADKWWLVDPEGYLFYSNGMDCVRHKDSTRLAGREALFAKPPAASGDTIDFYSANAELRYGTTDFAPLWKGTMDRRLKAWGFNTVANWSDPIMFENAALPFVTNVPSGRTRKSWQGFPDAYSPEFATAAEQAAKATCTKLRDNPFLIGYFIGNEPRWPYRNLLDLILNDTEPSDTQAFAKKFLAEKGDTPAARDLLFETISRQYFQGVVNAIKKSDPNHMVLGIRYAGNLPDPVLRANDVFEIFSINIYRFEPSARQIDHIYETVKKPVMIGEFHFGAVDRGYAPSLVMVKDQAERGVAYQYYVERAAAHPAIVGTHYFQLVDQPVSGRYDGENYNLGFLNQLDLPYPEMIRFAQETHRRVYQVHAGAEPPATRTAKVR